MIRRLFRRPGLPALLFLALSGLFAWPFQAAAQKIPAKVRHVAVVVHKSQTIFVPNTIRTATIASTTIADITPMSNHSLYIQGNRIGSTNVTIFGPDMHLIEILDLDVIPDVKTLQQRIRYLTGASSIRVTSSNGQIVLSGTARDATIAARAVELAKGMGKNTDVINAITVLPSQQVSLKVRFLEVNRSAERDLGVNWFVRNGNRGASSGIGNPDVLKSPGSSGISIVKSAGTLLSKTTGQPFGVVLANLVNDGTNIDVLISALEAKGLVRNLAEPNLTALSGDTAKFRAGGEIFVPSISSTTAGATTPSFQKVDYGVSLAFVPTVLAGGIINLQISPEVSSLDYANSVTISGTTVPGLVKRTAETTVELRDGQSFAIAGLLQSTNTRNINQLPWLGTVPVLGTLFRSAAYQKNESDLVIIVTPHLVHPVKPGEHIATPFDKRLSSNDVDFFLNGQMEVPKRYRDFVSSGGNIKGPYGHIVGIEPALPPVAKTGAVTK